MNRSAALALFLAAAAAFADGPNPNGAQTTFDVHKHGFNFVNTWQGDVLLDIPIIGRLNVGHAKGFGLCGGMSMSAADSFYAEVETPNDATQPEPQTPMRNWIYNRQLDSFRDDNAFLIRRLISWIPKPIKTNWTGTGLHVLTDRQFKRNIAPELDKNHPVNILLVKNDADDFLPSLDQLDPNKFQKNHQVLAIGYRLHAPPDGPRHWDVDIYDPNDPNQIDTLHYHENFRIQTNRTDVNGNLLPNHDRLDSNRCGSFRAFYVTPYKPKAPAWATPPSTGGTPGGIARTGNRGPLGIDLKDFKSPGTDEPPDAAEPDVRETDPVLAGGDAGPADPSAGGAAPGDPVGRIDLLEARIDDLLSRVAQLERAGRGGSIIPPQGAPKHSERDPGEAEPCCNIVANPELKGRLGRLIVQFPEGSSASGTPISVFRADAPDKAIEGKYGGMAADLMPGLYNVSISGRVVGGVEVRPRHDTRVRVGVLRVNAAGGTGVQVFEVGKPDALIGFYGSKDIGLPVGQFEVGIAGQREKVKIVEGKVTDF